MTSNYVFIYVRRAFQKQSSHGFVMMNAGLRRWNTFDWNGQIRPNLLSEPFLLKLNVKMWDIRKSYCQKSFYIFT